MLTFTTERRISVTEFRSVLERSTLAERRPVEDATALEAMLDHAGVLATCWADDLLVGIARSLTDFRYCCYLSDLAVDAGWQKQGIGKQLIETTRAALQPGCKIILLAAPAAVDYYPKIGFRHHPQAWLLD